MCVMVKLTNPKPTHEPKCYLIYKNSRQVLFETEKIDLLIGWSNFWLTSKINYSRLEYLYTLCDTTTIQLWMRTSENCIKKDIRPFLVYTIFTTKKPTSKEENVLWKIVYTIQRLFKAIKFMPYFPTYCYQAYPCSSHSCVFPRL